MLLIPLPPLPDPCSSCLLAASIVRLVPAETRTISASAAKNRPVFFLFAPLARFTRPRGGRGIATTAKLTPGVLASAPKGYLVHSSFSSCVVSKRTTETRERKKIDRTDISILFFFFFFFCIARKIEIQKGERENSENIRRLVKLASSRPNVYVYIYIGVGIENARESP